MTLVASEASDFFAGARVPNADGGVAGREDPFAVRGKADEDHSGRVASEREQCFARAGVQYPDGVAASGDQGTAIGSQTARALARDRQRRRK